MKRLDQLLKSSGRVVKKIEKFIYNKFHYIKYFTFDSFATSWPSTMTRSSTRSFWVHAMLMVMYSVITTYFWSVSATSNMIPILSTYIWCWAMICAMWISLDENHGRNGIYQPPSAILMGMMDGAFMLFGFYTLPMLLDKSGMAAKMLLGMMLAQFAIIHFYPSWSWFIVFVTMQHVANIF